MPPKAAYLRIETEDHLANEMFLAEKFGMTLGELRDRMSHDEYLLWCVWEGRKQQIQELGGRRR